MKRKSLLFLLLFALLAPWAANAQSLSQYTVTTGTETYTSIAADNLRLTSVYGDGGTQNVTLPFNFPFGDGNSYTSVTVRSDGYLYFGSSSPGHSSRNAWTSSSYYVIAPFLNYDGNLTSSGATSGAYCTTDDPDDPTMFIVEFKGLQCYYSPYGDYNFQVRLHKNGNISTVYGNSTLSTNSSASQNFFLTAGSSKICLTGSYANPVAGTPTSLPNFTVAPVEGQVITYVRPVIAYPSPTDLHMTESDHQSATLAWTAPMAGSNTLTGYAYQYKEASVTDWPTTDWYTELGASSTSVELTGLSASTNYNFRIKALYGDHASDTVTTNFATTAQATVVGDSWSDDFEGDACGWQLINGTLTNKWCWGTAANNGGTHALYVSNDNGVTNAYTVNSAAMVYATKLLSFTEGKYEFSFDWRANGEGSGDYIYDFLRVALVPTSVTLTAGTSLPSGFTAFALPTGWIAVDGGSYLNGVNTWQSNSATINVTAGNYYLVMAWRDDTSSGSQPPAAVDNVSINRVYCNYEVQGLAVSDITTNSAIITWTDGDPGEWQVATKAGNDGWITLTDTYTTNSATLSLNPSTSYQVRVRAYCGPEANNQGAWCTPISFDTECEAITSYPYSENFDDYTAGSGILPICWSSINTTTYSSYQGYPRIYNYSYSSSPNCLYFYSYASYNYSGTTTYDPQPQYAILPEMDNLSGKQIVLKARGYNVNSTFKVGVMSDPSDVSTFVEIPTTQALTTSYQQFIYDLPANATGRIAIMIEAANSSRTSNGVYVDDVIVRPAPDCATPTGLAVATNSLTPEGATITWIAGEGTEWTVEYKKDTEETWTTVTPNVTDSTYTFTGLDYNTIYNTRVSVACTGVTYPTNPVSFTTKVRFPAPTNLVTSNLTHNSVTLAWTAGYTNQTDWKVEYKKSSDDWTAAVTETVSNPTIDLSELVENTTYNVRVYGGIGTEFGTNALSGSFTTKNPCAAPTALVVSNITNSSATLSWTPGYQETEWTVLYWQEEATDTLRRVVNDSPTIRLTDLRAFTTYNVRVINCENALAGSFVTATVVPLIEAFANSSAPKGWAKYSGLLEHVLSDSIQLSSTTSGWNFGTGNGVFDNHAKLNIYSTTCKYWMVTPTVLMENNVQLTFDLALTKYSGTLEPVVDSLQQDDKFVVLISTNGRSNWTVLRQWDNAGSEYVYNDIPCSATGRHVTIDLSSYAGQYVAIAFYGESTNPSNMQNTGGDNNLHVDNVSIDYIPSCEKPTELTVSNVTAHTATFDWVENGTAEQWVLTYMTARDTISFRIDEKPYTLRDLAPETAFTAKLQAYCGEQDQSEESNIVSFTTPEACPAPTNLTVNDITGHTATMNWVGTSNSYIVTWGINNPVEQLKVDFSDGIPTDWTNDATYPWTVVDGYIKSGNAGVHNSTSAISLTMTFSVDGTIEFDAECMGEGTYTYWDHCDFYIDGTRKLYHGADLGSGWNHYSFDVTAGEHTFTWSYTKDSSQHPTGDYFAVDNVKVSLTNMVWDEPVTVQDTVYNFSGLSPETLYYVKLVGDCVSDSLSAEVNTTFTTTVACPTPTNLAADSITTSSALLSWNGTSDSYVVQYRPWNQVGEDQAATGVLTTYTYDLSDYSGNGSIAIRHYDVSDMFQLNVDDILVTNAAGDSVYTQDFETGVIPAEISNMDLDGDGYVWTIRENGEDANGNPYCNEDYCAASASWDYDPLFPDNWMIISGIELGGQLTFVARGQDPRYPSENFAVYVSVDTDYTEVTVNDTTKYLAENLMPNMPYAWQVKGVCGEDESHWAASFFTTLDDALVFVTDGDWNNVDNWEPAQLPTVDNNVRIEANAVIPAGVMAEAKKIKMGDDGSITIKDGGQLKHNSATLKVTMEKEINGYNQDNGNFYFISTPFSGRTKLTYDSGWSHVLNVTSGNYDLYAFDPTNGENEEWVNYKANSSHFYFQEANDGNPGLLNNVGYLMARQDTTTLEFTGTTWPSINHTETMGFASNNVNKGWALVGNPFTCNAYLSLANDEGEMLEANFYVMNATGDDVELAETANGIAPLTGAFICSDTTGTILISSEEPDQAKYTRTGKFSMNLTQGNKTIDQARIRFGQGMNLDKLVFNSNSSKLSIPQNGNDYAVVYSQGKGEMPVSFKAEKDGIYTIDFSAENVSFSYLVLVDNETGEKIDLIANPSYTFETEAGEFAKRFTIVYTTK